jgi:hypothetical protein
LWDIPSNKTIFLISSHNLIVIKLKQNQSQILINLNINKLKAIMSHHTLHLLYFGILYILFAGQNSIIASTFEHWFFICKNIALKKPKLRVFHFAGCSQPVNWFSVGSLWSWRGLGVNSRSCGSRCSRIFRIRKNGLVLMRAYC